MELSLLHQLQQLHRPILDDIMVLISSLGDAGFLWIVIALVLCLFPKSRVCGIHMIVAMLVGLVIGNLCLKNIIARPRPCWIDTSVPLLIPNPSDFSFPSGHTLSSFGAATSIFLWKRNYGLVALLFAGLMGFSRMYLFVHYPSDVLAGMLLGIAIAIMVKRVLWKEPY